MSLDMVYFNYRPDRGKNKGWLQTLRSSGKEKIFAPRQGRPDTFDLDNQAAFA